MKNATCAGSPIQFWPWPKRFRLLYDHMLRRSYRLFRFFPPVNCRSIFDVGADRGTFTDRALRCFDAQRVWLVEANPEAASALQKKYAADPRCKIIPAAIVAKSGRVQFKIDEHASSSSILALENQKEQRAAGRIVDVPALSLDDLFTQEKINELDLLKVDVQGAERMLIQGGSNALRRTRLVYIEVLFETGKSGAAWFGELHEMLSELGFKLRVLHRFRYSGDGYLLQADALYANVNQPAA